MDNNKEFVLLEIEKAFKKVEYKAYNDIMDLILIKYQDKYKKITNINYYRTIRKHPDEYKYPKVKEMKKYKPYGPEIYKPNTDGLYRPRVVTGLGSSVDEMICRHFMYDLNRSMKILKLSDIANNPLSMLDKLSNSLNEYAVLLTGDDFSILLDKERSSNYLSSDDLNKLINLFKEGLFFMIAGEAPDFFYDEIEEVAEEKFPHNYEHYTLPNMRELVYIDTITENIVNSGFDILRYNFQYTIYMFSMVCYELEIEFDKELLVNLIGKYTCNYDKVKCHFIDAIIEKNKQIINTHSFDRDKEADCIELKNYTNLDVLRYKKMDSVWLSKILYCEIDMVEKWIRRGMLIETDTLIYNNPKESYTMSILHALEWLRMNNKTKYVNRLEEYLKKPYKCEECLHTSNKNIKESIRESNNATIKYLSVNNITGRYLCNDCYEKRMVKECF